MSEEIKELVGRLRKTVYLGAAGTHCVNQDGPAAADALEAMAGEVETLQMKLAACGVGALANTERTVAQRITKESPHWSASLGDVYHIVDKEMEARAERDRLKAALAVPEVWTEEERDGMAAAWREAGQKHGMYETIFAVATWLLRHRARKALRGDA